MRVENNSSSENDSNREIATDGISSKSTLILRLRSLLNFYAKILLFLSCSLVLLGPVFELFVPRHLVYRKSDTFVSDGIEFSKQVTDASTLLIGDSVARQLYDGLEGHKTVFLWQSASLLGQYILLKNSLEANSGTIKRVVMIILPHTLMNNFDQPFTYLDIVRTLYTKENKPDFDRVSKAALFRFPLARLAQFSLFRMTDLIFYDYGKFNPHREKFDPYTGLVPYLSEISKVQLRRMRKLCRKSGVELIIRPAPVMEGGGADMTRLKHDLRAAKLSDMFKGYFEKLLILPKSSFRDDQIHLSDQYLQANIENIKKVIYTGS